MIFTNLFWVNLGISLLYGVAILLSPAPSPWGEGPVWNPYIIGMVASLILLLAGGIIPFDSHDSEDACLQGCFMGFTAGFVLVVIAPHAPLLVRIGAGALACIFGAMNAFFVWIDGRKWTPSMLNAIPVIGMPMTMVAGVGVYLSRRRLATRTL